MPRLRAPLFFVLVLLSAGLGALALGPRRSLIVLGALAAAVAAAALVLLVAARRSLPVTTGTFRVAGLHGPVEVVRDVDGVPHLYASTADDAWLALGWVHAQERLWQMEWGRRLARGRLAEILGPRSLPVDRFMRTLGIQRAADASWARLPAGARRTVEAYVAGINASLKQSGRRLPPEFGILRTRPEPWTPEDVVAAGKMVAWGLGGSWVTELLRADLERALGPERAARLLPTGEHARASAPTLAGSPLVATLPEGALPAGESVGTNLWAVSPGRSATGGAVLANDPHLPATAPGTWFVAHLVGGRLDAIGATIPGVPAVIIGRNRRIAWGIANLNSDAQDLYRERLDEAGERAEYRGDWEPLHIREESIRVRRRPDLPWTVRTTRHGPLITDAMNANSPEPGSREPLAFCWTGLDADDPSIGSLLGIATAESWDGFVDALRPYAVPPAVFGYADVDGNVGYHAAGRVPVRASGDGSRPTDGWTGEGEWKGWIAFDELPRSYNPPEGFVVAANAVPKGYTAFLGRDHVEPYRERRISELLRERGRLPLESHAGIQADTLSSQARTLLPLLLEQTEGRDERARRVLARLRAWDCDARADAPEGAVFAAWMRHLVKALLPPRLDPRVAAVYEVWPTYTGRFVASVLAGEDPDTADSAGAATDALHAALDDLAKRMGPDPDRWAWGRVHRALFPHQPLHAVGALRRWVSRSAPTGGDWSSVNLGSVSPATPYLQRSIPGYRQVVDLSHPDGGRFIHAPGQSGHPLSPHYSDYLDDWAAVRLRPLRMERTTVEAARASALCLEPDGHPPPQE